MTRTRVEARIRIFNAITAKRFRADTQWNQLSGEWLDENEVRLAVLMEAVGIVAQELLHAPINETDDPAIHKPIIHSLIAVAALCVTWLEDYEMYT